MANYIELLEAAWKELQKWANARAANIFIRLFHCEGKRGDDVNKKGVIN